MKRSTFLRIGTGTVLGLAYGRMPTVPPQEVAADVALEFWPHSMTVSGGLCAPLSPVYEIVNFPTTERPVREALRSFQVVRSGVRS